jgi:thioredoxin
MSSLLQVNEQNFEAEVMVSEIPVLVEFGATWCGPCKTVEPELKAFAAEMQGRVKVVTVDIDQSPMIAQAMGVRSVPTFVLFKGGRPADGRQGAIRKAEMMAMVEKHLPRAQGSLNAKEVAGYLKQDRIVMVDIRPHDVWERSRITGAVSFPMDTFDTRLAELITLGKTPVLYCRTGADAKAIAQKMAEAGAPIAYLDGGVLAWETEGFRLDRPS